MNDFEYDVLQKKRIANQARYRKNGSKSKKCSLSTDGMTRRQWERKCGEVMTYRIGQPMSWEEFKSIPRDIQEDYLKSLVEKYSATCADLAMMFGCTAATVSRFCKQNNIDVGFHVGKRMTKEERARFKEFLSVDQEPDEIEEPDEVEDIEPCEPESQEPERNEDVEPHRLSEKSDSTIMKNATFLFYGSLKPEMVYNSLRSILPDDARGELKISFSLE